MLLKAGAGSKCVFLGVFSCGAIEKQALLLCGSFLGFGPLLLVVAVTRTALFACLLVRFQVEDLGSCTGNYLRVSNWKRGYSAAVRRAGNNRQHCSNCRQSTPFHRQNHFVWHVHALSCVVRGGVTQQSAVENLVGAKQIVNVLQRVAHAFHPSSGLDDAAFCLDTRRTVRKAGALP